MAFKLELRPDYLSFNHKSLDFRISIKCKSSRTLSTIPIIQPIEIQIKNAQEFKPKPKLKV